MRAHIAVLALALAAAVVIGGRSAGAEESAAVEGRILVITSAVAMSADGTVTGPSVSLYIDTGGELVSANLDDVTEVLSAKGQSLAPSQLRPGDRVLIEGAREPPDRVHASRVVKLGA